MKVDEDTGRFSNLHWYIFNNLPTIQLTFINLCYIGKSGVKLKLTMKAPERRQWRRFGVLLALNIFHTIF